MAFAPKIGRPGQKEEAAPAGHVRSASAWTARPAREPAPADLAAAVERAARFGHQFARVPAGSGPPPAGAILPEPAGVIQGKLTVEFGSTGSKINNLRIKGRPDWAKQVDKTLSKEESEKPYFNADGKLKEGFVRGHIVEWNTRRRALQNRYKNMSKADLAEHLSIARSADDRTIQNALHQHLKDVYNDPANLAVTDARDFDAGGTANTLAQEIESGKGSQEKLQKLYQVAFNPGLSKKGLTQQKIAEYNQDFQDAWGVDPAEEGWHRELLAQVESGQQAATPVEELKEAEGEKEPANDSRSGKAKRKRSELVGQATPTPRPEEQTGEPPQKKKKKNTDVVQTPPPRRLQPAARSGSASRKNNRNRNRNRNRKKEARDRR